MTAEYQYSPFSSPSEQIRLLHLEPFRATQDVSQTATIRCSLQPVPLDSEVRYVALSYVWGPPIPQNTIFVDGLPLSVGPNLYSALQHIRNEVDEIPFWIDAICINQRDNEEKTLQVARMRYIYWQAVCVLIWLSDSTPDTDTAMMWIDQLGTELLQKGIEDVRHEDVTQWSDDMISSFKDPHAEKRKEIRNYFVQFVTWVQKGRDPLFWRKAQLGKRPWFNREWCLQECSNGKEVVFQCGNSTVLYDRYWATALFTSMFASWAVRFYHTGGESVDAGTRRLIDGTDMIFPTSALGIRHLVQHQPEDERLSLKNLLCRANVLKPSGVRTEATMPIDQYGPAGQEEKRCAIAYTKTAKQLLVRGHLDILGLCRRRTIKEGLLPSWVPHWAAKNREPWMGYQEGLFSASGSSSASISFFDADGSSSTTETMSITGVRVDSIAQLGQEWTVNLNAEELSDHCATVTRLLSDISRFLSQSPIYAPRGVEEGAWRVPICDLEQGNLSSTLHRVTPESKYGYLI